MTYESIKSKVYTSANTIDQPKNYQVPKYIAAIQAVFELHEPNHNDICRNCLRRSPCPTIKALVKELNDGSD